MNLNFSMPPQMVGTLLIEMITNLTDSDEDRKFSAKQENFDILTNLLSQLSKEDLTKILAIPQIKEELLELSNNSTFTKPHYYEHNHSNIWKGEEIGHNLSRIFLNAISSENKNEEEFKEMVVYSLDNNNYSLFQQLLKQHKYDLDEALHEHMGKTKWFLPENSTLLRIPLKMKSWEPILQRIKDPKLAHNILEYIVKDKCRFSSPEMASMAEEIIKLSAISNPEKFKIQGRFIESSFIENGQHYVGNELHEYLQTLRDSKNQQKAKIDFLFSKIISKNDDTENTIENFLNQPETEFNLNSEKLLMVWDNTKGDFGYSSLSQNMLSLLIKNKNVSEWMKNDFKKEFLQKIFMLSLMDRTLESKEKRNFFMKKIYSEGPRNYTENIIYHINKDIGFEPKTEKKEQSDYYFSLKPITELLAFYKNNNIVISEGQKISSLAPFFNNFHNTIQIKKGKRITIAEKCYHFTEILNKFEKDYENMTHEELKNYFVSLAEMGGAISFHNKIETQLKKDFLFGVEKEINTLLDKYPNINFSFETTQKGEFTKNIQILMNEKNIKNSLKNSQINKTPTRF